MAWTKVPQGRVELAISWSGMRSGQFIETLAKNGKSLVRWRDGNSSPKMQKKMSVSRDLALL